jgi:hypothetical protein
VIVVRKAGLQLGPPFSSEQHMKQEFIAVDHFVHGGLGSVKRDQALLLTPALGADLAKRNLVRPKHTPTVAPEKSSTAGTELTSSALPAVLVSPQTIASRSVGGDTLTSKKVRRKGA